MTPHPIKVGEVHHSNDHRVLYSARWYYPPGHVRGEPPVPAPSLMNVVHAAAYLQLTNKNPARTLYNYRLSGRLKGSRVGNEYVYKIDDLDAFVDLMAK